MDFLKKHYEKLVLSVVLLVVAVAAFWLTQKVSEVRQTLDEQLKQQVGGKKKTLKPVDLTNDIAALKQLGSAPRLRIDGDNNLFNPIRWVRGANNSLIPDPRKDPTALLKLITELKSSIRIYIQQDGSPLLLHTILDSLQIFEQQNVLLQVTKDKYLFAQFKSCSGCKTI